MGTMSPGIENFTIVCRVPEDSCVLKRENLRAMASDLLDYVGQIKTTAAPIIESAEAPTVVRNKAGSILGLCGRLERIAISHDIRRKGIV